MNRARLDRMMVQKGLAATRSQAENYIKLGFVTVDGKTAVKSGLPVGGDSKIVLSLKEQYVSRAALKLEGAASKFGLDFKDKLVLDAGSSTGGFTDYALKHGARKVIAVDTGTDQLHPSLRGNPRIELHENTDIRNFKPEDYPDIVLVDVSFISLREVLPSIASISGKNTQIIALLKPQFEAGKASLNKGVVKNDKLRRQIMKDFEFWSRDLFVIRAKADSGVAGAHGNVERFYQLSLRGVML
ncbi:MAG TPA: TlyA family RNA methyltransferase [Candidatus Saccharimonadales bacterium]|nr:TlyA family RNA methyltransferase [Candidatus Saccharimonadales bacterium]